MKIGIILARILLGLGFIIFGANILFPFLSMPLPPEGSLTAQFMGVMVPTHWMMLVGLCQLLGGIMVLAGGTAPLGLIVLGPVLVNILAFHIFIQGGEGLLPGLVFSALEAFLISAYRGHFQSLMTANAKPS